MKSLAASFGLRLLHKTLTVRMTCTTVDLGVAQLRMLNVAQLRMLKVAQTSASKLCVVTGSCSSNLGPLLSHVP